MNDNRDLVLAYVDWKGHATAKEVLDALSVYDWPSNEFFGKAGDPVALAEVERRLEANSVEPNK